MPTHQEIADDLLTPLWQGISPEYKSKYRRSIWQQFEDNIRSAAYTAKLSTFLSKITQRLGVEIAGRHVQQVTVLMDNAEDKAVLKMLRDETALLVLMVRVANEERKEKYEQKNKKETPSGDENIPRHGQGAFFNQP